jgi:DNA replication protein DnaC
MHMEQMLRQMREMRLSNMADALQERLRKGDHRDLSHEEFIALLVEDEYSARKGRKLARAIGRANFRPEQACIENLRFSPSRGLAKKDVMAYTTGTWIEGNQFLVITGATGTGKTYLAEAIGLRACALGYSALKVRYRKLLDDIASARGTGTYDKLVRTIEKAKVLVIDDFAICQADKRQCSDLLELLEDREQRGPMIITSQYPVDEWHSRFADPTVADAICDRLVHASHRIELSGGSLRKNPKPPEEDAPR